MSFQQRNTVVMLVISSVLLLYLGVRVFFMVQQGTFEPPAVFRLWLVIIVIMVVGTIISIILTTIGHSIVTAVRTGEEPDESDFFEDERDQLIELKGTRFAYTVTSVGMLIAMLTFVFGLPPLVMFTTLIAASLIGQISGSIFQLTRYNVGV